MMGQTGAGQNQLDPAMKKFILCRGITSLILTSLIFIAMLTAIINIGVQYGNLLTNDAVCSLKAAYGLFVVATGMALFLIVWDGINLCMMYYTQGCCHCECYHMNVSLQFAAFGMILMGTIVYGSKDPDKVGVGFWFSLSAAILCLISGIMWLITQHLKRLFRGPTAAGSVGGGLDTLGGGGLGGGLGGL